MSGIVWRPSPELVAGANVTRLMRRHGIGDVDELVARSIRQQEWFWDAIVDDLGIEFSRPYDEVRDVRRGHPWTDWYVGGELNLTANCLDRHLAGELADREALVTEREDGEIRRFSYRQLAAEVERCAAALRARGVGPGDRVGAYMPMCAEVAIQMLATIRVGAIFIPVFSGYAPAAVSERLRDAEAKLLFTAESSPRRGSPVPIRPAAERAAADTPSLGTVVLLRAAGEPPADPRFVSWEAFLDGASGEGGAEPMAAMDPALILYTSGTTGRPKGTVHSHAGSLVQIAKEVGYAFDMKPGERFFWLTDIGWMMGPWMLVGGLFHGATVYLYEGAFDWPRPDRLWETIARHRLSVLGISPTAIRKLAGGEGAGVGDHDLTSLRILGSTGEPWDEESWSWYFERVGGGRCPVINISGGTDIIGCFLSPLPLHPLKPCSLAAPGLGMAVDVWDEDGRPLRGEVGYLVATQPAPSMTRGLWNDPERYLEAYWSRWEGVWNHGDWALVDADNHWFLLGRADDTLKVAGRRIGPAEVEAALIETGKVREAAAVGVPHPIKGEGIVCFAVVKPPHEESEALRDELSGAVVERLGKVDRPERVLFVDDLPKTRSAKILRRLVRARHLGEEDLGDLSSLENPGALEAIAEAR